MKTDEMSVTAINDFANILNNGETADFIFNDFYYKIFESCDKGYIINIYSCNQRDENGDYLDKYIIDGGHCTGSAREAIEFML
ncbi:MAG: hypothetical protein J7L21_04230 [Sulfurimonas sp.]|nr:hypothetical protein [Sulfurimonas sp.]